ncbi:MAG TPA: DUF6265 family protein [Xanthomonadales bacterium]|nr:DUF6265 family protein [Xanthomonadales bacterium]
MTPALLVALATALSPAPDLDIGWLEGHWCGGDAAPGTEEIWTGGAHGMAVGLHKDLVADRATFEFMRIEVYGARATFFAQPSGEPPVPFRSTQRAPRGIVFANDANEYPKRVGYSSPDADTLEAWIDDGEGLKVQRWTWKRCTASPRG